jgi:hypothetical protein
VPRRSPGENAKIETIRTDHEGVIMSSTTISLIVFACVFGGALFGILLHGVLPPHHLSNDSKDIVKLGMGLVGTMAALVLGLLVASAKGSYDTQSAELTQMSANIVLLDRVLALYGPETKETRELLRGSVVRGLDQMWSANASRLAPPSAGGEILYGRIQGLSPKNDTQRSLQSQALSMAMDLAKTRWLMYEQTTTPVSMPLLVVLVIWLAVIFVSFGLFAPANATVVASLFVSALSVSGAIFLILEMYTPYTGVIALSSAPPSRILGNSRL